MTGRIGELLLILIIIFILFGAGRLPQVIHQLVKSVKLLKKTYKRKIKK